MLSIILYIILILKPEIALKKLIFTKMHIILIFIRNIYLLFYMVAFQTKITRLIFITVYLKFYPNTMKK